MTWEHDDMNPAGQPARYGARPANNPKPDPQAPSNRPLKIIVVDDCSEVLKFIEVGVQSGFKNVNVLKFTDGEEAWQELVREEPDYLISDLARTGVDGCELLRRLAQRRVKFPILIVSAATPALQKTARLCAGRGLDVSFLAKPFALGDLVTAIEDGLSRRRERLDAAKEVGRRPLRIVHVDDEPSMHDIMALMLQHPLKNLELFQFEDSVTALHVLSRFDPDLLITDDRMPKVCGCDIVRQLAERKATFPIIVTSGWSPTNHWFKEFADRGMRISFLSIPYEGKTFYEHLSKLLGPLG